MKWILPAGIVALVLAGGGWWYSQQGAGTTAAPGQIAQVNTGEAAEIDLSTVQEMTLGAVDAPIEVIEYASFTCPHCASFHQSVFKDLKANYIDTGKVRFTYREVYFDKYGMWGSLVARCGGEAKFFGIVDLLYKGQSEWARAGSDPAVAEEMRKIGRLAGMDDAQLNSCLSDATKLQTLIAWFQQNAETHGIDSTPSFVIDGQKYSNMNYADFAKILDERLGQ